MSRAPLKFENVELDLSSYQLRRNGSVIKLERIPMELLILLASRNGQLVSREEIIEKLWGKNVFVDSEHGVVVVQPCWIEAAVEPPAAQSCAAAM